MRKILYLIIFTFCTGLYAQEPEKLNSAEIYKKIQKMNFLGSVLYVAAHPDDENTRLISYLSNHLNARTGYLSLTRGDGGQNLIGSQLRELLGIIRTQELLAAREIDGGEQFFTRANDFGYSKHPEETLNIWDKEMVLNDVIRTIRSFRPDIIINRFDHTTPGSTHGHHTTSAILSVEAFHVSGKEQDEIERGEPWQPRKLFFNTSPWFYGSQEAFEEADKSGFIEFDTGQYFPLLGLSNTEIASLSRSQHRSQGFGSTGSRGRQTEYIRLIAGEHPKNNNNLFEGINTTWSRVNGGNQIGELLSKVEREYNFKEPSASLPDLIEAYSMIQNLEDRHWRELKTEQIKEIIAAAAGLYLEAVSAEQSATPGEELRVEFEVINRSPAQMSLSRIELAPVQKVLTPDIALKNNEDWTETVRVMIPETTAYSTPYWLRERGTLGMYHVDNPELIGLPETPSQFRATFNIDFNGTEIPFERDIIFKRTDPVLGEIYQPFEIVPQASVSPANRVEIFADTASKSIPITVRATVENFKGVLELQHPDSWTVSPTSYNVDFINEGEVRTFLFTVKPPKDQEEAILQPQLRSNGSIFSREIVRIDFEHIPLQTVLLPSEVKVVKLDIEKSGNLIGYIEGAGDVVPQALQQIGYTVVTIPPAEISAENLLRFDAVVLGIRAFNVVDELKNRQDELFRYVEQGGNLVVQYNTTGGLKTDKLAPFNLQLSRDRVTDEGAQVQIIAPNHPLVNTPNKITEQDFDGWVQERGLYFPNEWSQEFTPVLSMSDPGETDKKGSLLVAPYGKGYYIYTGLSFFREFPAGVPGAFRLFANLLSIGKEENEKQ